MSGNLTRINPETGVIEEQDGLLGNFLEMWSPVIGDNGEIMRVNPDTGVLEESDRLDQVLGIWAPKL